MATGITMYLDFNVGGRHKKIHHKEGKLHNDR